MGLGLGCCWAESWIRAGAKQVCVRTHMRPCVLIRGSSVEAATQQEELSVHSGG